MPVVRTYGCADCGHFIEVTLTMEQVDDPPPDCPYCANRAMQQEFKAPGIVNHSARSRATALAEDIMQKDYGVADFQRARQLGDRPSVRYSDQSNTMQRSTWGQAHAALEQAVAIGRQTRLKHGSGLDVLQSALKTGAQPDLIEASKRRAIRVWE